MKLNLNIYSFNFLNIKINIIGILAVSLLIGFIFTQKGNAASFQLSGKVLNSFNTPIVNAKIEIFKSESNMSIAYAVSDINGYYNFVIDEGVYIIKITGFKDNGLKSEITFKQTVSKDTVFNIILVSDTPERINSDFYNLITNPLYK